MKRWLAWILIPALALSSFSGAAALSEDEMPGTAEIQESVITDEGDREPDTLNDNLRLIIDTFHSPEFQDLLKNDEVKDVLSEGTTRVAIWLLENRTVTMKILKELGVSEKDRQCVEKIWDSASRLYNLEQEYEQSEDGQLLRAEIQALWNNPVFQQFLKDYRTSMETIDFRELLKAVKRTVEEGPDSPGDPDLATVFRAEGVEDDSIPAALIMVFLSFAQLNQVSNRSLKLLLKEKDFWTVVLHIANNRLNMDQLPMLEEFRKLTSDPEVMDFLAASGKNIVVLISTLHSTVNNPTETNNGKEAE